MPKDGDPLKDDIEAAAQTAADRRLAARIRKAQLVVVGEVGDVGAGPKLRRPVETEHHPEWATAFVKVHDALKGKPEGDTLRVVFPRSSDELLDRIAEARAGTAGDPDPPAGPEGEGVAGAARARPDRARSARRAAAGAARPRSQARRGGRVMPVSVVNMIPNSMSNESQRDAEPNITATFLDPNADRGLRRSRPTRWAPGNAPIYVSTNGGSTWALNAVLPGGNKTGDTTLRFVGPSNVLYAGILRSDNGDLVILRKPNFTAAGLMDALVTKTNDDQPYVEGATVMAGRGHGERPRLRRRERLRRRLRPHRDDRPLARRGDRAARRPGSARTRSRRGRPAGQDGPPIRPAVHLDGTVYGVYMAWRSATTMDIVVVRDDTWGSGRVAVHRARRPGRLGSPGRVVATGVSRCPLRQLCSARSASAASARSRSTPATARSSTSPGRTARPARTRRSTCAARPTAA